MNIVNFPLDPRELVLCCLRPVYHRQPLVSTKIFNGDSTVSKYTWLNEVGVIYLREMNNILNRRIREHSRELIRAPQRGPRPEALHVIDLILNVGNITRRKFLEVGILGNDGGYELIDSLI